MDADDDLAQQLEEANRRMAETAAESRALREAGQQLRAQARRRREELEAIQDQIRRQIKAPDATGETT